MDLQQYCREQNAISFSEFINQILLQQFICLGEDHSSPVHTENERKIITAFLQKGRILNLACEELIGEIYHLKKEMLEGFPFNERKTIRPPTLTMTEDLRKLTTYQTIVLVGNNHLYGHNSLDEMLINRGITKAAVAIHQESFSVPLGIYTARTMRDQAYIIVGSLSL